MQLSLQASTDYGSDWTPEASVRTSACSLVAGRGGEKPGLIAGLSENLEKAGAKHANKYMYSLWRIPLTGV